MQFIIFLSDYKKMRNLIGMTLNWQFFFFFNYKNRPTVRGLTFKTPMVSGDWELCSQTFVCDTPQLHMFALHPAQKRHFFLLKILILCSSSFPFSKVLVALETNIFSSFCANNLLIQSNRVSAESALS